MATETFGAKIIISFYRDPLEKADDPKSVILATTQQLEKIVTEIGTLNQTMNKKWKPGRKIMVRNNKQCIK